ncbi:SEC7-like, alpha orthogonal bundle [Ostreococcus tauri]|uniref:SEC7-like, alpha orthogonal bundle n=1 Tax=Ostreococcus tauri TaxID=70448 RepID=A0A096P929_OSTTA|nr:SEC7-like, alpha orthogonal bundle [Ostreococcus tauri]CEG00507.1 SEC7-like, alpha orthogonal bundle [Ostreococcus tauri]|eukprot:XP_003083798.2 SEC7-like, alpha orthogonal bundle [Ostreococcus tauri]
MADANADAVTVREIFLAFVNAAREDLGVLARVGFANHHARALLQRCDGIVQDLDDADDARARAVATTALDALAFAMRERRGRRSALAAETAIKLIERGFGRGVARDAGGDDAASDDARARLVRAVCGVGELSGGGEGGGGETGEDRARCGVAATRFAQACACGETEDPETSGESGDDGEGQKTLVVRGNALLYATRSIFHVAMIAEDENARRAAKTTLTQIINAAFKRAERGFEALAASEDVSANRRLHLEDVKQILIMLCKIAARDGPIDVDAYLTHSKALALDILRQLMEGPRAPLWLDHFHGELSKPLSMALMRNALLHVPRGSEAEQSVGILVSIARMAYGVLVSRARSVWKQQIAALYPIMALHPLETDETSAAVRVSALRLVRRLASEAQILVDFFVNYDCDLHAANLYERTVAALARAAQTNDILERDAVLTCLFSILRSLQSWCARGYDDEDEESAGDADQNDGLEIRPFIGRKPSKDKLSSSSKSNEASTTSTPAAVAAATATVATDATAVSEDAAAASSPPTKSESELFAAKKSAKISAERAIEAFNAEPNVRSLRVAARSEDAVACAAFLRSASSSTASSKATSSLVVSPSALGELLGSPDSDALAVMRAYVHGFDFTGAHIDDAMRAFLSGFRLPGEAQKIDRLMEAFAARFCACNQNVYPSTDAAYILAFAIVMLNTDAHNPLTEEAMKMSEQDFVLMVTAAEAASEVDAEKIAAIYKRVCAKEIKMNSAEPPARVSSATDVAAEIAAAAKHPPQTSWSQLTSSLNFAAPWKARSMQKEATNETAELLKSTKELFKTSGPGDSAAHDDSASALFVRASEPGLARPMLDVAGKFMLIALSTAFTSAPDAAHAAMPLEATRAMLSLATTLQLPALRDNTRAFLVTAPGFGRPQGISSQSKEALSTLLELATSECSLGGVQAWASVLEIIDRLEHLRSVVGAGVAFDFAAARAVMRERLEFDENDATDRSVSSDRSSFDGTPGHPLSQLDPAELAVIKWVSTHGGEAIERVFAASTRFDSDEILTYATAVATVSRHGLWSSSSAPAKIFALLRLTEVAATNMSRVRLVWSKLWSVVSEHLVEAVKHADEKVVLHATVSMRQVADRLLLRARATRSATQMDAMRPFVFAIENARTARSRGLVVSCVAQAMHNYGDVLGQGWEPAMEALGAAYAIDCSRDDAETQETLEEEMVTSCRALEQALVLALTRDDSSTDESENEESDVFGVPLSCVPRATSLFVAMARWRNVSEGGEQGTLSPPIDSLRTIAIECRSRMSATSDCVKYRVSAIWTAICGALGELSKVDDSALAVVFSLFDDDEIETLDVNARDELRGALDGLLEVKIDPTHATEIVLPRLLALAKSRRAAYEALLPTIWSFASAVLHSNDSYAVMKSLESFREAAKVASSRRDESEETWGELCRALRRGVVVDAVILDLPHASNVIARSLACISACNDVRKISGAPRKAIDEIVDIVDAAYVFARNQNDSSASLGAMARLEFAAGDVLLRALREDKTKRERFFAHVARCLDVRKPVVDDSDEDESAPRKRAMAAADAGDAVLRSNALAPARERLAARALASLNLNDDVDALRVIASSAVEALGVVSGAPLGDALADFFDSPIARTTLAL